MSGTGQGDPSPFFFKEGVMTDLNNVPSFEPAKAKVPPSAIVESKKTHSQPKSDEKANLEGFNQEMPKADQYSEERMSDAIPDRAVESGVVDRTVMPG